MGHELRIADVGVAIGKRQLERFGNRVKIGRAVVPHLFQIEAFENVQRLQHHEALRVRRALVHVNAAIARADRRVLEWLIRGQILGGDDAAARLEKRCGVPGKIAAIEHVRSLRRDLAQGSRQIAVHEHVAHRKRFPVPEPDLRRRRKLRQLVTAALQALGQRRRDREPLFRNLDGRREHLGQRSSAVLLHRQRGAADRAGHRDRQRTIFRDAALGLVEIDRRRPRREAGAVDELHLVRLRQIDEHEHVGAEAGHAGFDLALHRPRRHRGIDGVAAGLENPHARFGGERMAGGDHPVLRRDGRPPARLPLCGEVNGTRQQGEHRDNASWLRHQFLLVRR